MIEITRSTVSYSEFIPLLGVNQDLDEKIACDVIRMACIDFCDKTSMLRRVCYENSYCGIHEFKINLNEEQEVLQRMYRLYVNDSLYTVYNEGTLINNYNNKNVAYIDATNVCHLFPAPSCNECNGIRYSMCIKPSANSNVVDSILYDNYKESIINLAFSKLYLLPGPWKNLNLASYYYNISQRDIRDKLESKFVGLGTGTIDIDLIRFSI